MVRAMVSPAETMEFWLYDHRLNTRCTLEVKADLVVIGRDDGCDIVLKSPFVARQHARIFRKGNQLFVESLGRSGTRLANCELMPRQPARLDFGEEVQIAQFTVAAVRPEGKDVSREGLAAQQELQAKLMVFEQQIHAELLERMNLRVTGNINKSDTGFVTQIFEHLDQILSRRIEDIDNALIRHTMHMQLHRLVIAEVVRQCQGRIQTDYLPGDQQLGDPAHEQAMSELVNSIVDMMPLTFDPTSINEDMASAEDAFDDLFDQTVDSISKLLRRYIVHQTVAKDVRDILLGLGPLQDLLEMGNVSEIMVVGKDRIYVEKNGVIQPTTRSFFSDEVLMSVIERIISPVGRRVDQSTPLVDARLPDGSRVNVIISPLSLIGPCVTIRKFGWIPFTIDDLIERGAISEQCAAFLQACVVARKNMLVTGGTGSGKTTLLNVLTAYARPTERIVTIEELAELRLPQPHVVGLEGRPANIEGRGAYSIRELLRNALRMRPDRIIVGEVRGPEALDMLQAVNTGHDGSLSTLHANSPADVVKRLETLVVMAVDMPVRAIREQIVSAIDLIVHLVRFPDGRRRVTHITEITELDPDTQHVRLEDIFLLHQPDQPQLRRTGYLPTFTEQMITKKQIELKVLL